MKSTPKQNSLSKFLSLVLRHQPQLIGIHLDKEGWVEVQDLLEKMNLHGQKLLLEDLKEIVANNPKQRFAFNSEQNKLRASQGHSIPIELGYPNQQPPEILYHGTNEKSLESIFEKGIEKKNRHKVHLSTSLETALQVGSRKGNAVVLKVLSGRMFLHGHQFFLSDNGVWLTEYVAPIFLELN